MSILWSIRRDNLAWDKELKEDFATGGNHEKLIEKIDSESFGTIIPICQRLSRVGWIRNLDFLTIVLV